MKASEVHALYDQDLVQALKEAREEAFNLRFRHATGELENTAGLGGSRRDVARLLTVARERGIDVEQGAPKLMADEEKNNEEKTEDGRRGSPEAEDARRPKSRRPRRPPAEEAADEPRPRRRPPRRPRRGGPRRGGRPRRPGRRAPAGDGDERARRRSTPKQLRKRERSEAHRRGEAPAQPRGARRRARRGAAAGTPPTAAATAQRTPREARRVRRGHASGRARARREEGPPGHASSRRRPTRRSPSGSTSPAATRTYEKVVRRSAPCTPTTTQNEASEGDIVRIVETRPLSRTKRWRLVEIVERAR